MNAFGTSFFHGDSTPLKPIVATGIAIGSSNTNTSNDIGYIFAYDYGVNAARTLALNHPGGFVGIGTTTPPQALDVNGRARIRSIPLLSPTFGTVCFNQAGDLLQCGASSLRLKTNVQAFSNGLDIIRRLRPISFQWKEGGLADIGLGAEQVAQVAPSFVFTNSAGTVEGVKYERLNILLINAVKEQQAQIERQQRQINELKAVKAKNAELNAQLSGILTRLARLEPSRARQAGKKKISNRK